MTEFLALKQSTLFKAFIWWISNSLYTLLIWHCPWWTQLLIQRILNAKKSKKTGNYLFWPKNTFYSLSCSLVLTILHSIDGNAVLTTCNVGLFSCSNDSLHSRLLMSRPIKFRSFCASSISRRSFSASNLRLAIFWHLVNANAASAWRSLRVGLL